MHFPLVIILSSVLQPNVTWREKSKQELHWENFKLNYNKRYDSIDEETNRKRIFYENLHKIKLHNERFRQGLETFEMGINHFSDMTSSEFDTYLDANLSDSSFEKSVNEFHNVSAIWWFTHDINWYESAIRVRDQGSCHACWAFAATALLEYEFYRRSQCVRLSAQELVDCTSSMYGCRGGWTQKALDFVKKWGIDYEIDYPYEMKKASRCRMNRKKIAPQIIKQVKTLKQSEQAMYEHLRFGPFKVAIYANAEAFQHYKSGYLTPKNCQRKRVNHAVVTLGAIRENNIPLWFIRNSFGPDWGIKGHAKLLMNHNTCNLLQRKPVYIVT